MPLATKIDVISLCMREHSRLSLRGSLTLHRIIISFNKLLQIEVEGGYKERILTA